MTEHHQRGDRAELRQRKFERRQRSGLDDIPPDAADEQLPERLREDELRRRTGIGAGQNHCKRTLQRVAFGTPFARRRIGAEGRVAGDQPVERGVRCQVTRGQEGLACKKRLFRWRGS